MFFLQIQGLIFHSKISGNFLFCSLKNAPESLGLGKWRVGCAVEIGEEGFVPLAWISTYEKRPSNGLCKYAKNVFFVAEDVELNSNVRRIAPISQQSWLFHMMCNLDGFVQSNDVEMLSTRYKCNS